MTLVCCGPNHGKTDIIHSVETLPDGVAIQGKNGKEQLLFDDLLGLVEYDDSIEITLCPKAKSRRRVVTYSYRQSPQCDEIQSFLRVHLPKRRHFLILINPVSGKGNAKSLWEKTAKPLFDVAGCTYEVIVTSKPREGIEIGESHPLATAQVTVDAIIVVSGDGLVWETLQGLRKRNSNIPIIQFPGGSGNGLMASVHYDAQESFCAVTAVRLAIRGKSKPLDLFTVDYWDANELATVTCYLSVTCGIVADLDSESEVFRFLGAARFTLVGIWRAFALRAYTGEVYYRAPECTTSLPPLSEEIPSDFVRVDMPHFAAINIVNLPLIAEGTFAHPDCSYDDGLLYLIVIVCKSRIEMIKILLGMDDGSYLKHPAVRVIPCTAFRLIPEPRSKGNLLLDGEHFPFGPVQGSILPGATRIHAFDSRRNVEEPVSSI